MPRKNDSRREHVAQLKSLLQASGSITRAMAVVPESHLYTALLRGFRVWPYRAAPMNAALVPVLQALVDEMRVVLDAEIAAVGIGRFPDQPFDPWVVSGVSEELKTQVGALYPRGTLERVAVRGETIRIKDIRAHPDFKGLPADDPRITNFLAIPIRLDGLTLGNLCFCNKIGSDEFSEEDELIAGVMAPFAALAIQQTYLRCVSDIKQSEAQALLDSVASGVIFLDKETGFLTANDAAMTLFQRRLTETIEEWFDRSIVLTAKGEQIEPSKRPSMKALSGETVLGQEMQVKRADGSLIPVRVNAAPVFGTSKEILGAVIVFENISLEKRIEQLRQQAVSMIMHDIRNPIQAVLMGAESIRQLPDLDASVKKRAQLIEDSGRVVVSLTDRLLDAARIESSQVNLELGTLDLRTLIERVVARASSVYPEYRFVIHSPQESVKARMDPVRMDRVIMNLIDNAAKYSAKGTEIQICLTVDQKGFEIWIVDHGPGMVPELLANIFEPYRRGVDSRTQSSGGLGLGLFIVKGIVEAHGGTVKVESKLGKGSTFRLRFPASSRVQAAAS